MSPNLAASALYETGALRALFDVVRSEIEVALQASPELPVEDPDAPLKGLAISDFVVAPGDLAKMMRDFEKFLVKYGERPSEHPDRERYRFFYALYPAPGPSTREEARARALSLLHVLELGEWQDRVMTEVSGGVARLVAFCMAAVAPGRIVILDEPTNDVDPLRRKFLWQHVRDMADAGSAVLLVT